MKKTILIAVGALLIIIMVAIWLYLFIFGKPESSEQIFTNLGFTNETDTVSPGTGVNTTPTENAMGDTGRSSHITQITNRPVAGAFIADNDVRFVEQGTGHIYEINIQSGDEKIISGTTIPQTMHAVFSPHGTGVAITSYTTNNARTVIGTIARDGVFEGVSLPEGALEVSFKSDAIAYYLLKNDSGSSGFEFDIEKEVSSEVFAIPLRDVRVLWGNPHYIFTTPSASQIGYIYRIHKKSDLQFVTKGSFGLMGIRYGGGIAYSSIEKNSLVTYAQATTGVAVLQAVPFVPEKCTPSPVRAGDIICAAPNSVSKNFPDSWYAGETSHADIIWGINTLTGDAYLVTDPLTEIGRDIDVSYISIDEKASKLIFINKNDNSLWMYTSE